MRSARRLPRPLAPRAPFAALAVAVACALVTLACLLGATPARAAAVEVEVVLDETHFLPGEEIQVGVRVSNLSGRAVTFGTTTNWLYFFVETRSGDIVNRLGPVPVAGEFTLESSKAGVKWWNIQPWFDFEQSGPYLVYAEIRLPDWNQRIVSDPAEFTLQPARKLWEVSFGVPPSPDQTNALPEIRKYALQSATRSRDRKLYARVTDESEARIYKVIQLDRLLSFSNPAQQLDAQSRLHVLFQTGGSTYTYCIVNPDGDLVGRQRHEITPGSRPRLSKEEDGSIIVRGGRRQPTIADVPPYVPPPSSELTNSAPPAPTVTNTPASESKGKSRRSSRSKSKTTTTTTTTE